MSAEFRQYVTDSGVNFDRITVDQKRQWRIAFDQTKKQPAGLIIGLIIIEN